MMSEFSPATPDQMTDPPVGPDEAFPLAPLAVKSACDLFWDMTGVSPSERIEKEDRMTRVNTILGDFGKQDLHPYVYTAAMLSDIYDATAAYQRSAEGLRALKRYTADIGTSDDERDHVLGLLGDRRSTHYFWEDSIRLLHKGDATMLPIVLDRSNLLPVSDELWLETEILKDTDPERAIQYFVNLDTHTTSNIDPKSLLIEAAEALVWLESDEATNDTRTYQLVHRVEVLLAPLCEFMGMTAFASHLRSETLKRRLINVGGTHALARAGEYIESLDSQEDIERQTQTMIETALGEQLSQRIVDNTSNHGIIVGEGLCTLEALFIEWRLKSLGSLAFKLFNYEADSELPMDIIAATVTVSDESQIAGIIAHIVARVNESLRTTPHPSPSKEHALHICGDESYLESIVTSLGHESIDAAKHVVSIKKAGEREFHVAKMTFVYSEYEKTPLRVEIMVTTADDRQDARTGLPAHGLYKLGVDISKNYKDIDKALLTALTGAFASLKSNRPHLKNPKLSDKSRERGETLMRELDTIPFS